MKRAYIYLIGGLLVIAAAAAIVLAIRDSNNQDDKTSNQPTSSATTPSAKKACTIFTLGDAKQLMGDTAKGGANDINGSSTDLAVSTCTYTRDAGNNVPISSNNSATLLVRAPLTARGITGNQDQFSTLRPANAQAVSGYGDSAYWDPQYGQLDILKNNTWYILSYGPLTPADRTLDQTEQLAALLINKM